MLPNENAFLAQVLNEATEQIARVIYERMQNDRPLLTLDHKDKSVGLPHHGAISSLIDPKTGNDSCCHCDRRCRMV